MVFNFDDLLAGIAPTRVTVAVSAVDHSYEIEGLVKQLEAARQVEESDAKPERRLAEKSPVAQLEKRIKALQAEEDAAEQHEFVLRPCTPDEMQTIQVTDGDTRYLQMSMQCVEPALTPDQWRRLADALEAPRFSRICSAATALTLREGRGADFTRSTSGDDQT